MNENNPMNHCQEPKIHCQMAITMAEPNFHASHINQPAIPRTTRPPSPLVEPEEE